MEEVHRRGGTGVVVPASAYPTLLVTEVTTAYPQAVYELWKSTAEVSLGMVVLVFFPPAVPFCSLELGFGFGFP